MATENLHFDVAAVLVERGAHPNQWDGWGRAPAVCRGRPAHRAHTGGGPELLLAAGANPNAKLKKLFPSFRSIGADRGADLMLTIGTTPLIRAAKAGELAVIQLLLAHGANPSLPHSRGITPLRAAAGLGSDEIDTRGAL